MYESLGPDHLHGVHAWTAFFEWTMVFTAQIGYFYTLNHDMKGESIIEQNDQSLREKMVPKAEMSTVTPRKPAR